MSDIQSETTDVSTSDSTTTELNELPESDSPRRRRRRVEVPSELDIDNDRVFTNEDILVEAKQDVDVKPADPDSLAEVLSLLAETPKAASPASKESTEATGTRKRTRRVAATPEALIEKADVSDLNESTTPVQEDTEAKPKTRTRKRTVAAEKDQTEPAKPTRPLKPTIGATISADVVAQMTPASAPASEPQTRRRSRKSSDAVANDAPQKTASRSRRSKSPRTNKSDNGTLAHIAADLGVDEEFEVDKKILKKRVKKLGTGKATGRYCMYVHVDGRGNTQLAITEGRILTEHYVSRSDIDETSSIDGNIYLGRVQNVLPGMEAAFVDIATPKNAVLYRADVMYDHEKYPRQPPRIEEALRNGQMALVQVTKNPIAHKGARLTQEVSLAGRFVVLIPKQPDTYGISKRLPDEERRRLRRILDEIRPNDAGLIVRTAAEGATDDELRRDMLRLSQQWEQIKTVAAQAEKAHSATLLYKEPPLVMRMIREEFNREFRSIVIDDKALYEEIRQYVESITPELADRVEYYNPDEELTIYERYHVTEQLTKALEPKVWLPSGGSLIIERTEALTVIDVNTGKNVGSSNLEETVYHNNLEAADEIARQLRLRDIGGIIVIDFIDMEIEKNRFALTDRLREALSRDKTRTQVFEVTELGLVQMTRKRLSEGMVESFADMCPACEGRGFVIDLEMVGGFAPIAVAQKHEEENNAAVVEAPASSSKKKSSRKS